MTDYLGNSIGWSALGFIVGYSACRLEVMWRTYWRHRDHS